MPDFQDSDQTSNSTLTKLLEVDSELAIQEGELLSELKSVQEKRRSLKIVLSLFSEADTQKTVPIEEPVQTDVAEIGNEVEPVDSDLASPALETSPEIATAQAETEAASDTESNGAKTTVSYPNRRNKTTKFTRPLKVTKKASGWQQYVRDEFRNASLSDAVSLVLQRQFDQVFAIPAIVNSIFVDELPQEVGNKARRQVTNILSEGARKNKWYRGQLGYYSMSRAAAEANSP